MVAEYAPVVRQYCAHSACSSCYCMDSKEADLVADADKEGYIVSGFRFQVSGFRL